MLKHLRRPLSLVFGHASGGGFSTFLWCCCLLSFCCSWTRCFPFFAISFRNDQQPAIGSLAETFGRHPGIVLENRMYDAPVGGAKRVHRYGFSLPLGFFAQTQCHILE